MKEGFKFGGKLLLGIIIFAIVTAGCLVYYYAVKTAETKIDTNIIRNSNEFVQTKQNLLIKLVSDYQDLEVKILEYSKDKSNDAIVAGLEAQEKAIIKRINAERVYIEKEFVPESVVSFLQEHGAY
ncbi:MAG: hypothetical protein WCG91_03215 [Candidatus Shapirobacteria bacterium]